MPGEEQDTGGQGAGGDSGEDKTSLLGDAGGQGDDGQEPQGDQGAEGKAGGDGAQGEGDAGKEKPTGAPESYEAFKVPEGLTVDDTALTEYAQLAKEANLSQEQAQQMVDFGARIAQNAVKSVLDEGNAQISKWAEDSKKDPDIGGDKLKPALAAGRVAIDKWGSPALVQALNETGLGNHPEVIKFFAKIGALAQEDRIVGGSGGNQSADQDLATLLYGKTSKA